MNSSTLAEIDLTMRSWFASDEDPNLRIRDAYNYWQCVERPQNEFTENWRQLSWLEQIMGNMGDNLLRSYKPDTEQYFIKVFDVPSDDPDLYPLGNGEQCDMCGTTLNPLTSSSYCLCDECNEYDHTKPQNDELI